MPAAPVSGMWNKITNHIGVWLGLDEERGGRERKNSSRMRPSLSLSILHNPQLSAVRNSKSTDNLFRVSGKANGAAFEGSARAFPLSPSKKSSSSFFSLRRGRKSEKKQKRSMTTQENGLSQASSGDDFTQSSHSAATSTSNAIFNFIRRSRSRSTNRNEAIVVSRGATVAPTNRVPTSTSVDFAALRRRRPRSAHFDPNTIVLQSPSVVPEQHVEEHYKQLEKLGEGSYAVVYKCENIHTGAIVALKQIKLENQEGLPFTAIREASLLRGLRHANIVSLHDIFHQRLTLTFVFEYMKDDLSRFLDAHPEGLDPFQIKLLLFQLLRGLAFCHEKKILHRDLKPQNLLINEEGELKLADFGLARAKSVPSATFSHEVVTMWYRPPDVLLGSTKYSTSLDVWGVGCILAEMCTGEALFPGRKDAMEQLEIIFRIRGTPNRGTWPQVEQLPNYTPELFLEMKVMAWAEVDEKITRIKNGQDLLTNLLQLNPAERMSASAAMLHPYFSNLPPAIHLLPPTTSIFSLPQLKPLHLR